MNRQFSRTPKIRRNPEDEKRDKMAEALKAAIYRGWDQKSKKPRGKKKKK